MRLQVSFLGSVFPASKTLCQRFNLDYDNTVAVYINIVRPNDRAASEGFKELYALGNKVDVLRTLVQANRADLFAQMQFVEEDVKEVQAEFLGRTYYDPGDDDYGDPREVYVPPEGKMILLFTKAA